jgi:beta-lactamase class C
VQGYRGAIALLPQRDLGVAILWNGESSLPSGLLPTILDRAIGLPAQRWLDVDPFPDVLYAEDDHEQPNRPNLPRTGKHGGAQASSANANPR